MPNIIKTGGGSGGLKYNIFVRPTEPVVKDGIWIQSPSEINFKDIICKPNFVISGTWNALDTYTATSLNDSNSVLFMEYLDNNTIRYMNNYTNYNSGMTSYAQSLYEYKYNIATKTHSLVSTLVQGNTPSTSSGVYRTAYSDKIYRLNTKECAFCQNDNYVYLYNRNIDTTTWDGTSNYVYNRYNNSGEKIQINYTSIPYVYYDTDYKKIRYLTSCNYSYFTSYLGYMEFPFSETSFTGACVNNPIKIKEGRYASALFPIDDTHIFIFPCGNGDTNIVNFNTTTNTTTTVSALPTDVYTFYVRNKSVAIYNKNKIVVPISISVPTNNNKCLGIYDVSSNTWSYITLPYDNSGYKYVLHQATLYCFYKTATTDYSVAIDLTTNTLRTINSYGNVLCAITENGSESLMAIIRPDGISSSKSKFASYQLSQENLAENSLAIIKDRKYSTCIINRDTFLKSVKKYSTDVVDFNSNISINYGFSNAWIFNNGKYNEYPTYYGNGTSWIKFKN